MPIYFWQGGANCWGEGVAERGKGVGARRVGEGGWGDGGGEGGGERGWGEALIKVLNKTGIVTLSLVIVKHFTRRNQPKIAILTGIPDFLGESPCNDITFSEIRHNLARKKSENEMCGRFHLIIYARRSSHLGKVKKSLTSNF